MENLGKSVQRVTASSTGLTRASAEQHRKNILAAERTKLMLDCWRTGGANSAETFVTAVAATLARYPDQVIYDVTDPRSGLPIQINWMPSIKEVYDACERAYLPIRTQVEREKRIAEQIEARTRDDEGRTERPSFDDLKAKYGPNWGMESATPRPDRGDAKAPTADQLRHHYQHYRLAFEPKSETLSQANQRKSNDHGLDRSQEPLA